MNLHRPPHHLFGLPAGARFFFEEPTDTNSGAGIGGEADLSLFEPVPGDDGKPPEGAPAPERVEGEKLPDFGSLGKKPAAKPVEPAKPAGDGKPPAATEKPPTAKPDAKPAPAKEPPKAPDATKKAAEPAKPAAKATPPAKAGPKPGEKAAAKEEVKTDLPELPENDEDLDALQPKAGAPGHVIKSFNDIKALAKKERDAARAYRAELETVRTEAESLKQSVGKVPPEVEEELTGLRNLSLVLQAENDPNFKKEWDAKITTADETAYGWLTERGLPQATLDKIKAAGGVHKAAPLINQIYKMLAEGPKGRPELADPIAAQKLVGLVQSREAVENERATKIKDLTASREKFNEAVAQRDEQARTEFSKAIEQKSIQLAADNDWILEEDVPANATKEAKEAIEARNAIVKGRANAFGDNVRASYSRDPEKVAEIAFNAVKAEYLTEKLAEVETARDKATARVASLEAQLQKIKSAGRIAHVETPATVTKEAPKTTVEEGKIGGDGATALSNFFAKRT